jgi:hypothetical protein
MRKLLRFALIAALGLGPIACTGAQTASLLPRTGTSGHTLHVMDGNNGGIIPGCDPTVSSC